MDSKNIKIMLVFLAVLLGTIYLFKRTGGSSCQCCNHAAHVEHAHDHSHDDHHNH